MVNRLIPALLISLASSHSLAEPGGAAPEPARAAHAQSAEITTALKRLRELNRELGSKVDAALAQAERSAPQVQREVLRLRDELQRQAPALQRELEAIMRRLEDLGRRPTPVQTPIEI